MKLTVDKCIEALAVLEELADGYDKPAIPTREYRILKTALESLLLYRSDWAKIDAAVAASEVSVGSVMGRITGRMIAGKNFDDALSAVAQWLREKPSAPGGEG